MKTLAFAVLLCLGGCATSGATRDESASKSLYDRLGGKEAITAVVDEFVNRVAAGRRG